MDASQLLALPEELLAVITGHVSVDSLLDFALASSATHRHARHRLERNRALHTELSVQHDRMPLQSPTLLRRALNDPEATWHLRAFESWGVRPGFAKWKTWRFYENMTDEERRQWLGPNEDYSTRDATFYEPEEMVEYRMILMDLLQLSPSNVHKWIERLREGWDEPIKGILFALAPRLDRLIFIAYDSWQGSEYHDEDPLDFLSLAIRSVYDSLHLGAVWPPGFMSLRMISICNSTSLRHPHDSYCANPSRIASLFLLPNIRVLNFTLLGYHDDPDPDFFLPPRSSSVEELSFSCCSTTLHAVVKFIQACKRLRCYSSANSDVGSDGKEYYKVARSLSRDHGTYLEELSLDSYSGCLSTLATSFPRLKSIDRLTTQDLVKGEMKQTKDLEFRSAYMPRMLRSVKAGDITPVEFLALNCVLPYSIQRLGLSVLTGAVGMRELPIRGEALRAVADLVEDERFSNLKEICLCGLRRLDMPRETNMWNEMDEIALDRIKAQGIDTHEDAESSRPGMRRHRIQRQGIGLGLVMNETDLREIRDVQ